VRVVVYGRRGHDGVCDKSIINFINHTTNCVDEGESNKVEILHLATEMSSMDSEHDSSQMLTWSVLSPTPQLWCQHSSVTFR